MYKLTLLPEICQIQTPNPYIKYIFKKVQNKILPSTCENMCSVLKCNVEALYSMSTFPFPLWKFLVNNNFSNPAKNVGRTEIHATSVKCAKFISSCTTHFHSAKVQIGIMERLVSWWVLRAIKHRHRWENCTVVRTNTAITFQTLACLSSQHERTFSTNSLYSLQQLTNVPNRSV